jgi:hypothetical protein
MFNLVIINNIRTFWFSSVKKLNVSTILTLIAFFKFTQNKCLNINLDSYTSPASSLIHHKRLIWPRHSSGGYAPAFHRGGPGSNPGLVMWDFGWTKVALGQVFSENFGFPCQSSFHLLLHNHLHYHPRLAQ